MRDDETRTGPEMAGLSMAAIVRDYAPDLQKILDNESTALLVQSLGEIAAMLGPEELAKSALQLGYAMGRINWDGATVISEPLPSFNYEAMTVLVEKSSG